MKPEDESGPPPAQEGTMDALPATEMKRDDAASQAPSAALHPSRAEMTAEQKMCATAAVTHPVATGAVTHPVAPNGVDGNNNVPGAAGQAEFELARRLGVRYDSSNSAWVARWTDTQNDRKKSRWFSIAKYGNHSARRLAIQACLHNMKQSDFLNLRDLQDVLASFTAAPQNGPPGAPGYMVSGADMGGASPNMAGVVRGTGVDGGKMGPQFGHAQHMMHHPNPFGIPGMGQAGGMGYMNGMPGGMGMPGPGMGMFCQGVPHHQATLSVAPQEGEGEETTDANGQPIQRPIKTQFEGEAQQHELSTEQVKTVFDQTTTAASSVASPAAGDAVKMEQNGGAVGPQDQAFLQQMSGNPLPMTPPESASSSSSRFIISGGSSSQDSSDLETRSVGSDDDDEDDDDDEKEGGSKRKKRKLDDAGNAAAAASLQPAVANNNFGGMNMYNAQSGQPGMHNAIAAAAGHMHPSYYSMYPGFQHPHHQQMMMQMNGQAGQAGMHGLPFMFQPSMLPMLHPHFQAQHAAAAAAFLPHSHMQQNMEMQNGQGGQYHHLLKPPSPNAGLYLPPGANHYGHPGPVTGDSPQSQSAGDSPSSAQSPNADGGAGGSVPYKRHPGHSGSQSSSSSGGAGGPSASAKMTCERGLHYSKCYQGNQECWIAVWNTKGGRIMHEAFDVAEMGYEGAKQKAREARDAAHSNNVAVTENSRPSWKSHSNTGIPHVSLDSQQLRFRAHKFGRRLCRSFSFGRRRGSYASRESAFDAAVLWLIQTPTDEEIAAVSGCSSKMEDQM